MPGYTWDPRLGRYRASDGRIVSTGRIRSAIDREIRSLDAQARRLGDAYRRGDISINEWEQEMRSLVKDTHIMNAALAKGGVEQLTQSDYGRIGATLRREYDYLGNLAQELDIGIQATDGRFMLRVEMFARSGRRTFEASRTIEAAGRGLTEERSVLHPADHCEECVDMAAVGWVPIGTLIPIGDRQCLSNCRCTMDYR